MDKQNLLEQSPQSLAVVQARQVLDCGFGNSRKSLAHRPEIKHPSDGFRRGFFIGKKLTTK